MTYFDCLFPFFSGSQKNYVEASVLHLDLQPYIAQGQPTLLAIFVVKFILKYSGSVCTQTRAIRNVCRKLVLIGSLESEIRAVLDMSEILSKKQNRSFF